LIDLKSETYVIDARIPEDLDVIDHPEPSLFGRLFDFAVGRILECLPSVQTNAELAQYVREGRFSFLFDDQNRFISSGPD